MDHTHRFDGKSEIYEKIRPQSADGLFTCFRDTLKIPADSVFADNRRVYDRRGYIDRALSSSYFLKEADERFAAYVQARGEIFRSLCGRRAHHRADGHGRVYRKGLNRKRLPRLTERKKKRRLHQSALFLRHIISRTRGRKRPFSPRRARSKCRERCSPSGRSLL